MKHNQKGFGAVGVIACIIIVALVGFGGWYVLQKNKEQKESSKTAASTEAKSANGSESANTQTENQYAGWKQVVFSPENLTMKLPAAINVPDNALQDGNMPQMIIDLEQGYSLYITQIGDPASDNSYGNTASGAEEESFKVAGKQYYIVNTDISLAVSTCKDKVCAVPSNKAAGRSVLMQVYYSTPGQSGQQAPPPLPAAAPYQATVKNILKSFTF